MHMGDESGAFIDLQANCHEGQRHQISAEPTSRLCHPDPPPFPPNLILLRPAPQRSQAFSVHISNSTLQMTLFIAPERPPWMNIVTCQSRILESFNDACEFRVITGIPNGETTLLITSCNPPLGRICALRSTHSEIPQVFCRCVGVVGWWACGRTVAILWQGQVGWKEGKEAVLSARQGQSPPMRSGLEVFILHCCRVVFVRISGPWSWPIFRGHEDDILNRFCRSGKSVVRRASVRVDSHEKGAPTLAS